MKLIIASNNQNKIREIKEILSGKFSEILSLNEAGICHETIEDGETFMENAIKKAREISEISGCYAIADDSGICVEALGGAPGVYSARYAGEHGNDEENNALLIKNMEDKKNRKAYYIAAIALSSPEGEIVEAEGYMFGEVLYEPKGNGGFGYDPLIFLPEMNKTVAELTPTEKNKISHRAKALENLLRKL